MKKRLRSSIICIHQEKILWDGVEYDCTTLFYKGVLSEAFKPPQPIFDAAYNKGPSWISVKTAPEAFGYSKEIRDAVLQLIN